jgi:RNA polymerase sigma-70 factor (ECF subfamily)
LIFLHFVFLAQTNKDLLPDDITIIAQIRSGDLKAYERIFNEYYEPLCLFARKTIGDMDKARDIVQEVFVVLYANKGMLQINTSLKSYLFKCVYNSCLNNLKQQKVYAYHHEHLRKNAASIDGHDAILKTELEEKIRIAIESLPDQCRRIFKMNRYDGMKNSEIATELGISIRTVETQISKALNILRANLTDYLILVLIFLIF